jgi:ubiquinone/menaquinone biosynthesis C-methylase UbiE
MAGTGVAESHALKSKQLYPGVFSRHALDYDRRLEQIMVRGEARGRLRVLELVDARPGMRILDLACGPGTLTRRLAAQVSPDGEVVGVDLAPGMIELAQAAGTPNTRFEVMDIEQLSFPDASFDGAACGHGLQFAPDLGTALRETRRVLRPGARLAASVPVDATRDQVWSLLDEVVDRWLGPPPQAVDQKSTRDVVADRDRLTQAALDADFASAGVEVIEEKVSWQSAEQFVSQFAGWWFCASRMDGIAEDRRQKFIEEATATLRRAYPGEFATTGRNHVLVANA